MHSTVVDLGDYIEFQHDVEDCRLERFFKRILPDFPEDIQNKIKIEEIKLIEIPYNVRFTKLYKADFGYDGEDLKKILEEQGDVLVYVKQ